MRALILKAIICAAIITLSVGCSESPFLTKDEAQEIIDSLKASRDPFHTMNNVVAIIDNDVYYFNSLKEAPSKLTNTPDEAKTNIKLSADKSRIAYLNANGNPVIIKADDGEVLETLTQFDGIDQMDWAKDRLTLYMLIDREVVFYGELLEVIQPDSNHPWDEVSSFSMNSIGDQGYFIKYYGDFSDKLKFNSTSMGIDEFKNFDGETFDYIDFYDNKGNFLLGYNDTFEEGIARVICVQGYNFYAAYDWKDERMNTPEFNADTEVLLYGTMEDEVHRIKGVYLGTNAYVLDGGAQDILTMVLTDYTSKTPIYLDWVH